MKHSEIQKHLDDYLYGELQVELAQNITEHLKNCENCKQEFTKHQKMTSALENMKRVPSPPGFEGRVLMKIRGQSKVEKPLAIFLERIFFPKKMWIGALVSIVILLSVLVFQTKNTDPPNIIKPVVSAPESKTPSIETEPRNLPEKEAADDEKHSLSNRKRTADLSSKTYDNTENPKANSQDSKPVASDVEDDTVPGFNSKIEQRYTSAEGDYIFKSKGIPNWIKNPKTIYVVNQMGLNIVELKPARVASSFQTEDREDENDLAAASSPIFLNNNNILPLDLIVSSGKMEESLDILKRLFARFKTRELQTTLDSNITKVAGRIPQKNFLEFVSQLQSLGKPSTSPFRLSHNEYLEIEISISD